MAAAGPGGHDEVMDFDDEPRGSDWLRGLPLLDGVDDIDAVAAVLRRARLGDGEVLMAHGDDPSFFAVVVEGRLHIDLGDATGTAGPGSIVGELGVISRRPRRATVTASGESTVAIGDEAALEVLLAEPAVRQRVRDVAAARLAASTDPVAVTLGDGTTVWLRPLLDGDRPAVAGILRRWSADSLRRRFFTPVQPSDALVDYLLDIDYVDHFAWAVIDAPDRDEAVAVGRFIRAGSAERTRAEVAFGVEEAHRGKGLGTLLLGALAAAAAPAGIEVLTAELLSDNDAMRAVFGKADASFAFVEGGQVAAEMLVERAVQVIDHDSARRLAAAAAEVVTAAGVALVVGAESAGSVAACQADGTIEEEP